MAGEAATMTRLVKVFVDGREVEGTVLQEAPNSIRIGFVPEESGTAVVAWFWNEPGQRGHGRRLGDHGDTPIRFELPNEITQ
jgi:hypothetical protein